MANIDGFFVDLNLPWEFQGIIKEVIVFFDVKIVMIYFIGRLIIQFIYNIIFSLCY